MSAIPKDIEQDYDEDATDLCGLIRVTLPGQLKYIVKQFLIDRYWRAKHPNIIKVNPREEFDRYCDESNMC